MQPNTLDLMHDQVRAIYRVLTGQDLPEATAEGKAGQVSADTVARSFAALEQIARAIPQVTAQVPPFSFAPPLDVIDDERELLVEVAVPSVEKSDVTVSLNGDMLTISGVRGGERVSNGRTYRHAEIPRGPFSRVVLLPYVALGEPRVEAENGLIRIHLAKATKKTGAKA